MRELNIGDKITFKAITRWNRKKATRAVVGFDEVGRPLVRFGGYSDFVVCPGEIIHKKKWELIGKFNIQRGF